jgi:dolichol kinase
LQGDTIKDNSGTPMYGELQRKLIHYASAAIPIGYLFIPKGQVLIALCIILAVMLLIEFLKYKNDFLYHFYMRYFRHMLREHEYDRSKFRINGASWVIFASIFCIILFPKLVAVTGLLMLSFADSTSAILGRLYGKKQYAPNRSYVGTAVFFVIGIIIMFVSPKYFATPKEYILVFIAVIFTTVADALTIPVDDNFTIPVTCCTTMYLLYLLLYPGIVF